MPFNIIKSIIISPFKIFPNRQKLGLAPKMVSHALGTGSTRQGKLHKCYKCASFSALDTFVVLLWGGTATIHGWCLQAAFPFETPGLLDLLQLVHNAEGYLPIIWSQVVQG